MRVYLISMREPQPEALEAIRTEWPDDADRVELSDTSILVAHRNGGTSVFDLIKRRVEGDDFIALVVRVGPAYHGFEAGSLWSWLEDRVK